MGSGLSRVSQGEHLHKRYKASTRRHPIKIDKNKIGIPTDFRHTYHVGNASPVSEKMLGNQSTGALKTSTALVSDTEFIATMAQITDALQKVPLEKYTAHTTHYHYSRNSKSNKASYDQHLRRAVSSYNDRTVPTSEMVSRKAVSKKKHHHHHSNNHNNYHNYHNHGNHHYHDSDNFAIVPEKRRNSRLAVGEKIDFSSDESYCKFPRSLSAQVERIENNSMVLQHHPPQRKALISSAMMNSSMMDLSKPEDEYYDFGTCLQTKINAQIEYARARSNINKSRSPRMNMHSEKTLVPS